MSRELYSYTQDFTVDANFQAHINGLYTAIINRGWLQTSDTGQLANPYSGSTPSTGTYAGYYIFKTNDGVGSIFYLRLDLGRSGTRTPLTKIQVGTGTNGAGTLTGNVSTLYTISSAPADPGGISWRALVCGDAGRIGWSRTIDDRSNAWDSWTVGRTVDSGGTPNSNGMEIMCWSGGQGNNGLSHEFLPATGFSSVLEGPMAIVGDSPYRTSNWRLGAKSFFAHPVAIHRAGVQYPSPLAVIWDGGATVPGFMAMGIYRLTSYGTVREYLMIGLRTDATVGGAALGMRVD